MVDLLGLLLEKGDTINVMATAEAEIEPMRRPEAALSSL
jgi:hypothetical protein